jgi:hypothetical protein
MLNLIILIKKIDQQLAFSRKNQLNVGSPHFGSGYELIIQRISEFKFKNKKSIKI